MSFSSLSFLEDSFDVSSPYTQGVDYISITDEVRALARSVVDSLIDFTDDEIIRYQYMAYSQIRTITDKDDWDSTNREFGSLQLVETEIAASYIIEHYGTANDVQVWQAMRASGMAMLTTLVENMDSGDTGSGSSSIFETEYKSWNLNDLVAPPNRLKNVGIAEIDF